MGARQHYVPQFYLREFVIIDEKNKEDKVFCVCKDERKHISCTKRTRKMCFVNNGYEISWGENQPFAQKYIFEGEIDAFFQAREDVFSVNLRKIISKCKSNVGKLAFICTSEELKTLCEMIVDFIVRSPVLFNEDAFHEEKERIKNNCEIKKIEKEMKQCGLTNIDPCIEYAQKLNLYGMSEHHEEFDKAVSGLMKLNYTFFYSQHGFVTSDCPVIFQVNKENYQFSMAYLPLSSSVAVLFDERKENRNRCVEINKESVDRCNGQYLDYQYADMLISNRPFTLRDFPHITE